MFEFHFGEGHVYRVTGGPQTCSHGCVLGLFAEEVGKLISLERAAMVPDHYWGKTNGREYLVCMEWVEPAFKYFKLKPGGRVAHGF